MAIGNPLYHWSHLELKRYFGYDGCLNGDTAEEVWNLCNQKLKEDSTSVRNLIRRCRVRLLCTTDDPSDDLKWHQAIAADPYCELKVLPTWRPDRAMNMEKPDFPKYMWWLGETAGMKIDSFEALKEALGKRMDYFQSMGCLAADHGLEYVPFAPASLQEVEQISLQNGEARMGWTGDQITCEAVIGPGLYVLNVTYHTPEEREESRALLRQIESCL